MQRGVDDGQSRLVKPAFRRKPSFAVLLVALLPLAASLLRLDAARAEVAGGPPAAASQRRDADFLRRYAATYRFSLGRPAALALAPDGKQAFFLRSGPRDFVRNLFRVDTTTGVEIPLLTAEQLLAGQAEQLSAEELARRERMRLAARGIASFELSEDGQRLLVPLSGKLFVVDWQSGETRQIPGVSGAALDPQFSPQGDRVAWVSGGELFVAKVAGGASTRLTHGATETLTHGLAEFVAQEEMGRMHGYWWSPDGEQLVYQQTDTSGVELLHIADPAHPEQKPQDWRYPRAGGKNASVRLGIVPAGGGESRWIEWDREAFPYLANVRWDEGAPLMMLVQNRAQTIAQLLEVDPSNGAIKRLFEETDDAWINLDPTVPRWSKAADGFLWSSERNGSAQLELRERDGSLARPLHPTSIVYRGLLAIDAAGEQAFIAGNESPREMHVYRVSLASQDLPTKLTREAGMHSAVFSKDAKVWIDTLSSPAGEITQTIRHATNEPDGKPKRSASPEHRLTSAAETPQTPLHLEWTTVTDDAIQTIIVRPDRFVAGRRYPTIVHVYGGPHSQMVASAGNRYLLDQWLANQGYIVVAFDGRGTPGRTRAWERAIRGNLIEIPLEDQVRALRAVAKQVREIDLDRVGIFGWSFGGYFSALATIRRPDVFQVGVAGAPVTDWRDYDTHYTERYLGMPDADKKGYDASSALVGAGALRRPLLLIHGTADDNVYFLHSLKLADALFRADRACEFLPLAGMTHMVTEPTAHQMLYERILSTFDRVLKPTAAK